MSTPANFSGKSRRSILTALVVVAFSPSGGAWLVASQI